MFSFFFFLHPRIVEQCAIIKIFCIRCIYCNNHILLDLHKCSCTKYHRTFKACQTTPVKSWIQDDDININYNFPHIETQALHHQNSEKWANGWLVSQCICLTILLSPSDLGAAPTSVTCTVAVVDTGGLSDNATLYIYVCKLRSYVVA